MHAPVPRALETATYGAVGRDPRHHRSFCEHLYDYGAVKTTIPNGLISNAPQFLGPEYIVKMLAIRYMQLCSTLFVGNSRNIE